MIPEIPNYENFLKATNKAFPILPCSCRLWCQMFEKNTKTLSGLQNQASLYVLQPDRIWTKLLPEETTSDYGRKSGTLAACREYRVLERHMLIADGYTKGKRAIYIARNHDDTWLRTINGIFSLHSSQQSEIFHCQKSNLGFYFLDTKHRGIDPSARINKKFGEQTFGNKKAWQNNL